jgi:hypothetical protein
MILTLWRFCGRIRGARFCRNQKKKFSRFFVPCSLLFAPWRGVIHNLFLGDEKNTAVDKFFQAKGLMFS